MAAVPSSASGTVTPGMMVAQALRRKRKMTITTSAIVSARVNSTSSTDALIVVVRFDDRIDLDRRRHGGHGVRQQLLRRGTRPR